MLYIEPKKWQYVATITKLIRHCTLRRNVCAIVWGDTNSAPHTKTTQRNTDRYLYRGRFMVIIVCFGHFARAASPQRARFWFPYLPLSVPRTLARFTHVKDLGTFSHLAISARATGSVAQTTTLTIVGTPLTYIAQVLLTAVSQI